MEKIPRPHSVPASITVVQLAECGNLYVTISRYQNKMFEVFATLGKSGGCMHSTLASLTVAITMGLRHGLDPQIFIDKLEGVSCSSVTWQEGAPYLSCPDAIAKVMITELGKISAGYYKEEDKRFEAEIEKK